MKTFTTTFNKLRTNDSLRLDFGIRYVDDILDYNPLGIKNNFIILSDVLSEIKSKKVKKGELEDPEFLIDLENINKRFNSLINVERVTAIDSDKTILQNGDLVIAKMTPKLGTMFLNTDHTKYLGSTELVEYKISGYDSLALYYILTSQNYLDVLGYMESGKNQRRVKPSDLLKLKIPLETKPFIEYAKQANDSIFDMFSKKKNMQQIIDASFLKELSISQKHSNKQLLTKLSVVGEDSFCRFSFHNQNYFNTFEFEKIENGEWCPIERKFTVKGGKRIPKGETFSSVETDYYYLRPTEVSILGLDKESFPYISEKIHDLLKRYSISTGEFCVSNVGTLGKIGLIHLDELGIKDGNLILSENFVKLTPIVTINEKFYYYFFNSYIFQKQIDREYTITSIMKLGLDKVKKISIPDFSKEKEERIINDIENELEEQRDLIKSIDSKRLEIDSKCASDFSA